MVLPGSHQMELTTTMTRHFDLLCIGGGSGGVATANRAGSYGAKVALIEMGRLGGTCVNVGCVPEEDHVDRRAVRARLRGRRRLRVLRAVPRFDWSKLKSARDGYVRNLNDVYAKYLASNHVEIVRGRAAFTGPKSVEVDGETITAEHIVIATGGQPVDAGDSGCRSGHHVGRLLRTRGATADAWPSSVPATWRWRSAG